MNSELQALNKITRALDRELSDLPAPARKRTLSWLYDYISSEYDMVMGYADRVVVDAQVEDESDQPADAIVVGGPDHGKLAEDLGGETADAAAKRPRAVK